MKKHIISLIVFILYAINAAAQGTIKGRILEQTTKHPIIGATIVVTENKLGAVTDTGGLFVIDNVPAGNYSLIISSIGYQLKVINDVEVIKSKTYYSEIELLDEENKLQEAKITSFKGENNPRAPVSSYSFSREEIFRNPGSQGDVFRAIGILPGVVSSGAQYSAIAVRGQGTPDNVYMVDGMPMFNLSHLEVEGFNSGFNDPNGGRFSLFAPRVIDNAQFQGGGFDAAYGRKASSLLSLGIKEGNNETPSLSGQFDLLGFTLIYDGPSGISKNTSVFATARYQNFTLLESLVGLQGTGAYSFGDYMVKTTTRINEKNKLSFIAMYNPEQYKRTADNVGVSGNVNGDNASTFIGNGSSNKAIFGLNLRTLTGQNSYWENVAYYRLSNVSNDLGYAYPLVSDNGDILDKNNIPSDPGLRHIKDNQGEAGYRSIFTRHYRKVTVTAGIDLAAVTLDYARSLKHTDTLYTFGPNDYRPDPTQYYLVLQPAQFNSGYNNTVFNGSGYVALSWKLFKVLTLNPSVRYDYTGFSEQHTVSPRISGSVSLDAKQSINFGSGIYYQDPGYIDVAGQPSGHKLMNERTFQNILGYRNYLAADVKLVVEGWYKQLDDLAVQPATGASYLTNKGTGYAYGADINLTKRLSKNYYGQVGYSYMVTRRNDHDGLGDYDYTFSEPHVISLLGSYKPNERWIFSGKFRYGTGRPTNKYTVHKNVYNDVNYLRYSQEIIGKNEDRLADFVSLDLRVDYRFKSKKFPLTAFVDIVDIQNRFNDNTDIFQPLTGKTYRIGLAIFPTFGVRVEL